MRTYRSPDHANDLRLSTLEKGSDVLAVLDKGSMVAVFSGRETMYIFRQSNHYLCYIHALDEPEGRAKSFPRDAMHQAILKNLADLGDQLFEVEYHPGMDRMEIMFTAEQGIVQYLDVTGKLPMDDMDFMSYKESAATQEGEGL